MKGQPQCHPDPLEAEPVETSKNGLPTMALNDGDEVKGHLVKATYTTKVVSSPGYAFLSAKHPYCIACLTNKVWECACSARSSMCPCQVCGYSLPSHPVETRDAYKTQAASPESYIHSMFLDAEAALLPEEYNEAKDASYRGKSTYLRCSGAISNPSESGSAPEKHTMQGYEEQRISQLQLWMKHRTGSNQYCRKKEAIHKKEAIRQIEGSNVWDTKQIRGAHTKQPAVDRQSKAQHTMHVCITFSSRCSSVSEGRAFGL